MATTTATQVQQLYVGLLGRAADQGGLNWWVDQVTTGGKTLEDIRASFVTSTEYKAVYGATTSRSDLVKAIYSNLFERTPSADEIKFWAETDTRPADQLVAAFIQFASANDQKTIDNKVFVANTYTSTVGADFNKDAAAAVIANVDGTAASVSAATAAIANGTLAGQVPGVSAIAALNTAFAEKTAFEAANVAKVNELVAKLAANVAPATATDGIDADTASYQAKVDAAVTDATQFRNDITTTTTVLTTMAQDAAAAVKTAYNALGDAKALADAYVSAEAAKTLAVGAKATGAEKAGAISGLAAETSSNAALITLGKTFDSAATDAAKAAAAVYTAYETGAKAATGTFTGTPAELRTAVDNALKGSAYYNTFKAVVVKDANANDATAKALAAKDALVLDTTEFGAGDTTGTAAGKTYVDNLGLKVAADANLADAQAADANLASATALKDAYAVQTGAVQSAQAKVDAINVDGKVAVHAIAVAKVGGAVTATDADLAKTVKDVFYFAATDKGNIVGASDKAIANFGAGDSLVLGSDLSYNKGALTAGDNNKAEFFLVQQGKDTLVVLETANYGSSDVAKAADGSLISGADHAAIITLTGVNVADLNVANGVISHVA